MVVTADSSLYRASSDTVTADGLFHGTTLSPATATSSVTAVGPLLSQTHKIHPVNVYPKFVPGESTVVHTHALTTVGGTASSAINTVWLAQSQTLVTDDVAVPLNPDSPAAKQDHQLVTADGTAAIQLAPVDLALEHLLLLSDANLQAVADGFVMGQQHILVSDDLYPTATIDDTYWVQEHLLSVTGLDQSMGMVALLLEQVHTLDVGLPSLSVQIHADLIVIDMVNLMRPAEVGVGVKMVGPQPLTQQHILTIPAAVACSLISVPAPPADDNSTIIGGTPGGSLSSGGGTTLASVGGSSFLGSGETSLVGGGSGSTISSGFVCPDAGPAEPVDLEEEVAQAKRVDFINDNLLYRGEADPGTLDSATFWRIRRITIGSDNDVTEEWAEGSAAYSFIWDDRLTYAYS